MKKLYFIAGFILATTGSALAQVSLDPMITPSTFDANTEITVEYDATGTALADLDAAYLWIWIPNTQIDAKYNINPGSSNPSLTDNVKFNKDISNDKTTFSLTFKPQDLFADPICDATQIGMLLKGDDWSDGQTTDFITSITPLSSCFVARLTEPSSTPAFVMKGNNLTFAATANENATFILKINGSTINSKSNIQNYNYSYSASLNQGTYPVAIEVVGSSGDSTITFDLLISEKSATLARPAGIIPGINYHSDNSKVTLCLMAPGKETAYVLSEINGFQVDNTYKMYKDGDYFWLEITGLTPGQEYAYQYFVDGHYVADPFADKILDPDDQWIPESIYPNLKPYPAAASRDTWFYNRVSVFETGQSEFNWQHTNYDKPKKENLVVYELLIRDFFAPDDRSYQNLIDTLSYLKRLGVNAIELLPIMEFNGNDSWGYNPNFMFAVDKAYGTREGFKQFIDAAHAEGMAVILDIVLNQQEYPNPYLVMYQENGQLAADNPMFNREARHPFNVFVDMNHESPYTQYYVDTVTHYWLNEYKVDGFRFDLSKGFTQNFTTDVGAWSAKDDSRIALLNRMGDAIWSHSPDAWLILEHFAANDEEKILADDGFMFWGNIHNDYKEAMIGYPNNKSIAWAYHQTRNWNEPNLLSYMESHDEERQMVEATNSGNENGLYKIKNFDTALERMKLGAAFFMTVPGPKMIWQFQELGYDFSINRCPDGTISNDCRTAAKPVRWDFYEDEDRLKLFNVYATLAKLKTEWPVFENGIFTWKPDGALKWMKLTNDDEAVYIIGNFGVTTSDFDIDFPKTGDWFDLFTGDAIDTEQQQIELAPGQFHIFTSKKVENVPADLVPWQPPVLTSAEDELQGNISIYPNPSTGKLNISMPEDKLMSGLRIMDISGRGQSYTFKNQRQASYQLDLAAFNPGMYIIEIISGNEKIVKKVMKQ